MDGSPFELPLFLLATFAGALVAGLSGFAFGLVAASIWLYILSPLQTATLIIAFGLIVQGYSVWKLRGALDWRKLWPFVAGAARGVSAGGRRNLSDERALDRRQGRDHGGNDKTVLDRATRPARRHLAWSETVWPPQRGGVPKNCAGAASRLGGRADRLGASVLRCHNDLSGAFTAARCGMVHVESRRS